MDNKDFEKLWLKATEKYKGLSHPEWGITKEIARKMYEKGYKICSHRKNESHIKIISMLKSGYEYVIDLKVMALQDWIYKNNTIPFKDMFTNKRFKEALENEEDKDVKEAVEYSLSNMRLATTDGGWNNTIELNKKIKEIFG